MPLRDDTQNPDAADRNRSHASRRLCHVIMSHHTVNMHMILPHAYWRHPSPGWISAVSALPLLRPKNEHSEA